MKTTNFVKIDGAKFKELIEGASGKTLKEISLENGFSDAFLRMVVKSGKASPSAQAVAKLYGIEPSAYELKEKPVEDPERVNNDSSTQLSIEDLARYSLNSSITEAIFITGRDEFKTIVKEAVKDVITDMLKDVEVIRKPKRAEDYLRALDPERKEDEQRKFDKRHEI